MYTDEESLKIVKIPSKMITLEESTVQVSKDDLSHYINHPR